MGRVWAGGRDTDHREMDANVAFGRPETDPTA